MKQTGLASGCSCFLITAALVAATQLRSFSGPPPQIVLGVPGKVSGEITVNFTYLAQHQPTMLEEPHSASPRVLREYPNLGASEEGASSVGMQRPSPAPSLGFQGLTDIGAVIPPNPQGAVGPTHLMTTLNAQICVQNRKGLPPTKLWLASFWKPVSGAPFCFDPRLSYDAMANRWIFTAAAYPGSAKSMVLVGVSKTSDPSGDWILYKIQADPTGERWADYPTFGFNRDWIVVSANMFLLSTTEHMPETNCYRVNLWVFDKNALYSGGDGSFKLFRDDSGVGFAISPTATQDAALKDMYMVDEWDPAAGELRMSILKGPVGEEVLILGAAYPKGEPWNYTRPDPMLPQLGSSQLIDQSDSRVVNSACRNGKIYAVQTVRLPAEGTPTRSAAQWWQLAPDGSVLQFGRVEDANFSYAFPSLCVNRNEDVLIGYSKFGATQYASANYSMRFGYDPPGRMRADALLKAGEGPYYKTFGSKYNRWGDYSSSVVDPVNGISMWTIQEYAEAPKGDPSVDGSGVWGIWWGRIDPGPELGSTSLGSTNFVLSFRSIAGQEYSIEYKNLMSAEAPWTLLRQIIGQGGMETIWDDVTSNRFYRVGVIFR